MPSLGVHSMLLYSLPTYNFHISLSGLAFSSQYADPPVTLFICVGECEFFLCWHILIVQKQHPRIIALQMEGNAFKFMFLTLHKCTQIYTNITEILNTPYSTDSQPSSLIIAHIMSCLTITHPPSTYYSTPIISKHCQLKTIQRFSTSSACIKN